MKIIIINGPNLNLLGRREPDVYGQITADDVVRDLQARYQNHVIDYYQSNVEGEIINRMQAADATHDAIILNAGGYTHTSVAIRDCIAAIKTPVVELHISNIYAREEFRHKSLLSAVSKGVICGFGTDGYRLAVEAVVGGIELDNAQ